MSTTSDVLRPSNRTTATVRGRAISLRKPASVTEKFFARGEEQEATAYEHLAPDDPILAPPALEFDSFDKIPRRRGSLFGAAVSMLVLAAIGFVTWRSFRSLSAPGSSVATASRAMVQAPPPPAEPGPVAQSMATPPAPAQSMTVDPPAPVATQSTAVAPPAPVAPPEPAAPPASVAQSAPVAPAEPAAKRAPAAQSAPVAKPAPIVIPLVTKPAPVAHERARTDTDDKPVAIRKHAPLRGYVWSPEKHTLVPADPVIEDLPPAESPRSQSLEGTPAEPPQPPPDPTSPAPFQPPPAQAPAAAPSSSTAPNGAPIIE